MVDVKELIIEGGNYSITTHLLRCNDCGAITRFDGSGNVVERCKVCDSENVIYLNKWFGAAGSFGRGRRGGHRRGRW
jgi:hypothetical protein